MGMGFILIPIFFTSYFSEAFTPAKWLIVYLLTSLTLLTCKPSYKLVPSKSSSTYLFFLGLAFYLLSTLVNGALSGYVNIYLDLLMSACLIYFGFIFAKTNGLSNWLSQILLYAVLGCSLVLGYACLQLLSIDPFNIGQSEVFPSSFFGYQNMTAEYLGYISLLLVYGISETRHSRILRVYCIILLLLSLIFIGIYQSRSVWLALGIALFFWLNIFYSPKVKRFTKWGLSLGIFGLLIYFAIPLYQETPSDFNVVKAGNIHLRKARVLNGIEMIKTNPWLGVGPGRFEFEYLPFHRKKTVDYEVSESLLVKAPHNGFLEAAIESGILFAALLVFVLFQWFRKMRIRSRETITIQSTMAFTIVQAFFAFPIENPFPFFWVMLVFGAGLTFQNIPLAMPLAPLVTTHEVSNKSVNVWNLRLLGVLLLAGTGLFGLSQYVEFNRHEDHQWSQVACRWFPSNWHVCMNLASVQVSEKNDAAALKTLEEILNRSPHHFLAHRLSSFVQFRQSNPEKACWHLQQFENAFRGGASKSEMIGKSSIYDRIVKLCPKIGS